MKTILMLLVSVFLFFCEGICSEKWVVEKNEKKVVDMFIKFSHLKDPSSVQFKEVVRYGDERKNTLNQIIIWCGYFNAKNSYGAYVGFKPFFSIYGKDGNGYVTFQESKVSEIEDVKRQMGNKTCEGSGVIF